MGIGYSTFCKKEGEFSVKYGLRPAIDCGVKFYRVSQLNSVREQQIKNNQ